MLPLSRLTAVNASNAAAGSLLIASRDRPSRPPCLVVGGATPMLMHLGGDQAFKIFPVGQNLDLCLASDHWRIEVDESDLVSPFNSMPGPGEVFYAGSVAGLSAHLNHGTAYVAMNGALLPEPDWATYVGFKRWRIVLDVNDCCGTHTVFEAGATRED